MDKKIKKDIIEWDIATWEEAIHFWESKIDWSKIKLGLEIGGRNGGLSLWLALKGKQMICSDLHETKKNAFPLHQSYNVTNLISYEDIDASQIPYENKFDVIIFKSIIGGIAKSGGIQIQQKVFDEIYKALKPGGVLLFAENLTASPLHQFARKKFNKWGSYWRYISISDTKKFLTKFINIEIQSTGFAAAFGQSEKQRNILSKLDKLFFNKLVPGSWKYVVYGVAFK